MEFAGADICMDDGVEAVRFTRAGLELTGDPGDIISLIPWGGEVSQVTTSGLRWPLHAETLSPDKTRGISNELLGSKASVTIGSGLLLVIRRRARHQNL
jgi:thiamine pyrophosphokinase